MTRSRDGFVFKLDELTKTDKPVHYRSIFIPAVADD